MNVADAMTPREDVVTVELPGTRDDVLEYLQERGFSSVPVVKRTDDGEAYRGIVTRQDLIEHPDENQLAVLMNDVPTTTADTSVEDVAHMMVEKNARRVPVVDGTLEGIITVTDVIRAIARGEVELDAGAADVATRDVNTTYEEAPLTVAEREIFYANVPYAVALDETGTMSGILTEVDIIDVARVVEGEDDTGDSVANQDDDWMWEGIKAVGNRYIPTRNVEIPAEPVSTFMSTDLVTVSKRTSAVEAAQAMITNDIEQIPLVGGDQLTGIVRDVDLLEAL
ncbi:CBS domain-containing protein [Halogeometricum borinquense]|uniref:CBS domain-containing protein n=2 Tax=Halogeometricum borinquense TaxID=60847 RepID=E4NS90_HALBP|nr:CBS domain-containing protein [Halogeometricum borinquense]ADQ65775.1 CBS domain-containing protein [Halogeometricum borinquense DSM 11551]ELY26778.1 cbs domain-containing protein [Halogeometricum borinquense DSM 11551]QIB72837.1 CBS domain-containing protein [Halogeometricum borinquense]QIQ75209.1 CBS domain-containing protein [Halogeometricum borinquense]RYJ15047.1 CBS domain-containing protein [Halogeometricum borinquense]